MAIAAEVAARARGETPHLDGSCPDCGDGEHVVFVNGLGREVTMPLPKAPWWQRLFG